MPRILTTGSTGYIGGSVLAAIHATYPECTISAMLRKITTRYTDAYPNVKIVQGDYDSAEIIATAAAESDIVIHAGDSDHRGAMEAILTGLKRRTSTTFLIHLSGTGCISDVYTGNLGTLNPKIWSDIDDITELASLPEDRMHRDVDKLVFEAAKTHGAHIHTAIMCPPDIYGEGRGPGITQSFMVPFFYDAILAHGSAFYIGQGENVRSTVHIDDVTSLYVKVVGEAIKSLETGTVQSEYWGDNASAFSEVRWKDMAAATGKIMTSMGLIKSEESTECSIEDVEKLPGSRLLSLYLYGSNGRSRADRATKYLDWKPTAPGLMESLQADLLAHHQDKQRSADIVAGKIAR
ncbi:unnamed protein product [Mycena citricolor]|uniref:NAD-dependent epimerase/dehydratase domain-containing protein n=1 Tax=Mycena citricolor TaxID=2018698 RepID=A0AAD2K3Y6_9AGAR|nr:unnamed protein product [Mycena citricolor]